MKKKFLALVFAGALMCGSVFQVSADSPKAEDVVNEIVSGSTADSIKGAGVSLKTDGESITINPTTSGTADVKISLDGTTLGEAAKAVDNAKNVEVGEEAASIEEALGGSLIPAEDIIVGAISRNDKDAIADIAAKIAIETQKTINENTGDKAVSISVQTTLVEITAPGNGIVSLNASSFGIDFNKVNKDQNVYVLHYRNGEAVMCPAVVSVGGVLSFYMDGFSPVAIVVENVTLEETGEDVPDSNDSGSQQTTSTSQAPVSPKTADANVAVVVMVAMMGVAGVVICQKKKRA